MVIKKPVIKKPRFKKPMSSFLRFSSDRRKVLNKCEPGLTVTEISQRLGSEWKVLDHNVKQNYVDNAKFEMDRFLARASAEVLHYGA